jgi:hypothetical protein
MEGMIEGASARGRHPSLRRNLRSQNNNDSDPAAGCSRVITYREGERMERLAMMMIVWNGRGDICSWHPTYLSWHGGSLRWNTKVVVKVSETISRGIWSFFYADFIPTW